jgi:esterase/lipase superfamily enzyme
MHIEENNWHSPHLDRDMVKVYGHWGQPFIVFPSSRGRYFDYEGMGMVAAIAPFIDGGRIKLFAWTVLTRTPGTIFRYRRPNAMPATSNMTGTSRQKWSHLCAATATMTVCGS